MTKQKLAGTFPEYRPDCFGPTTNVFKNSAPPPNFCLTCGGLGIDLKCQPAAAAVTYRRCSRCVCLGVCVSARATRTGAQQVSVPEPECICNCSALTHKKLWPSMRQSRASTARKRPGQPNERTKDQPTHPEYSF